MDKIVWVTEKEREALFENTSLKIGMNEAIVEKDFLGMLYIRIFIP